MKSPQWLGPCPPLQGPLAGDRGGRAGRRRWGALSSSIFPPDAQADVGSSSSAHRDTVQAMWEPAWLSHWTVSPLSVVSAWPGAQQFRCAHEKLSENQFTEGS